MKLTAPLPTLAQPSPEGKSIDLLILSRYFLKNVRFTTATALLSGSGSRRAPPASRPALPGQVAFRTFSGRGDVEAYLDTQMYSQSIQNAFLFLLRGSSVLKGYVLGHIGRDSGEWVIAIICCLNLPPRMGGGVPLPGDTVRPEP